MTREQLQRVLDLLSPTPGCTCQTCVQIRAARTLLLTLGSAK